MVKDLVQIMRHCGLIKRSSHYVIRPTLPGHGPLQEERGIMNNEERSIHQTARIQPRGTNGLDYGIQKIWVQDNPKAKSEKSREIDRT